jgi:serine phosphatase RsbU (regulator of sigma subunit)/CheY-like chemotaxis protein
LGQPEGRGRGVADILLVDDRPENLVALQAVLRPLGHNLVTAGSGEEALKRLLTEDFAVILLDVLMPGMDGFETAFQIKQRDRTRDVPIIFLTAISRDESDALQGFSSGAVDYVTKPYEGWMLRAKVQVFVELHQKTEQLKQQRELLATRLDQRFVEEARQLRKLADASLTLTSTLAVDSILDAVTEQARDIIGAHHAQTTVLLGEEDDEAPRRTSVSLVVSPEYEGWAASREGVQSSPLTQTVWQRMRPIRVPRGQAASRPEGRALETVEPRHPALQGWLAVPLAGHNARVLGLLEVADKEDGDFTEADESILVQLAQLASVAIENAELFEREHELAETLQRSLLPQRLPVLSEVRLAARYLPAGGGGDVGGDWYDAIALPGGQVVLAVGDVAGRGAQAAAVMGQLRIGMRAYALQGMDPADVLRSLDRLLQGLSAAYMATAFYLLLDPETETARYANAGHPPPLAIGPDGGLRWMEEGVAVPLGVQPDGDFRTYEMKVPRGSTLLLYTDGLVEERASPIDDGLTRLSRAVEPPDVDLNLLCDRVLERMDAQGKPDDVALLAARLAPAVGRIPRS